MLAAAVSEVADLVRCTVRSGEHTSDKFADIHEVFSHAKMETTFARGSGATTEAAIQDILAWKEKAAFMTRTTTIGAEHKRWARSFV